MRPCELIIVGVAGLSAGLNALPIDILMGVVFHTNVISTIKMTLVCNPIVFALVRVSDIHRIIARAPRAARLPADPLLVIQE